MGSSTSPAHTKTPQSTRNASTESLPLPLVLAAGAALRLALFSTSLPEVLESRLELSTPMTSFPRLREALHLLHHTPLSPYASPLTHHPPLVLALHSTLVPLDNPWVVDLYWTAVDVVAAAAFARVARSRMEGWKVAGLYLFNPLSILSALVRTTSSLHNTLIAGSIASAVSSNLPLSVFLLAICANLALYPALLLPPLALLLAKTRPAVPARTTIITTVALFLAHSLALLSLSRFVAGSWDFLSSVYGTLLTVPDLTPNVGLWWYFLTSQFDHFRPFFTFALQAHILIYALPLTLHLHNDPLLALTLSLGTLSTFVPYPSLASPLPYLALALSCFPHLTPHLRHPFLTAALYAYAAALLPLFRHLWLVTGTGNANFFYAATLLWGLAQGMGIVDLLWAEGKERFLRKQGAGKEGKEEEEGEWAVIQI